MTGLPLALQALVWAYALVAGGAILACLWTMWAGLATGRHRRHRTAALTDLGAALLYGVDVLLYGRAA